MNTRLLIRFMSRAWALVKRPYIAWKYRNHDALVLVGADGVVTRFCENVRRLLRMTPSERMRHYHRTYHPIDVAVIAPFLESIVRSYKMVRHVI